MLARFQPSVPRGGCTLERHARERGCNSRSETIAVPAREGVADIRQGASRQQLRLEVASVKGTCPEAAPDDARLADTRRMRSQAYRRHATRVLRATICGRRKKRAARRKRPCPAASERGRRCHFMSVALSRRASAPAAETFLPQKTPFTTSTACSYFPVSYYCPSFFSFQRS
jgi:hypothetical protein